MKQLSKIVFINSAKTRHEEIKLDGNVHLVGTQGVGKSTFLRAILFFYNADPQKLGVPSTRNIGKSFAEWYFPHPDSYIVYEVSTDAGHYCVLARRRESDNGVTFNFIDSTYKPDLILDGNNSAYKSWMDLRSNLGARGVGYTANIETYTDFQNIIYGRHKDKMFSKYALMYAKSSSMNIRSAIQNIFLNTKVEADFIKQTIVDSIGVIDDEYKIDFDRFTKDLKDLDKKIRDIRTFKSENVQKKADLAIQKYHEIDVTKENRKKLISKLKSKFKTLEPERLQAIAAKEKLENSLATLSAKRNEKESAYEQEKVKTEKNIGIQENNLRRAKDKQSKYEVLNIAEVKRRVDCKDEVEDRIDSLNREKNILFEGHKSIVAKYEEIIHNIEIDAKLGCSRKKGEISSVRENRSSKLSELVKQYETRQNEIREKFESQLETGRRATHAWLNTINSLEQERTKIDARDLFREEINEKLKNKEKHEADLAQSQKQIQELSKTIDDTGKEVRRLEEAISSGADKEIAGVDREIKSLESKIAEIEAMLQDFSGSLFDFLNNNRPGWEDTIGRVCKDSVLFSKDLEPVLLESPASVLSLYGVEINTNAIAHPVKSLEDYRKEQESQRNYIEKLKKDKRDIISQQNKDIDAANRRARGKVQDLKQQKQSAEYQVSILPNKIESASVLLENLRYKASEEKRNELLRVEEDINKAKVSLKNARDHENELMRDKDKSLEDSQSSRTRAEQEINSQYRAEEEKLKENIRDIKETCKKNVLEKKQEMQQALESKGVDGGKQKEIEAAITAEKNELQYIKKNERDVSDYEKDKKDLIDRIPQFKQSLEELEQEKSKLIASRDLWIDEFSQAEIDLLNKKTKKEQIIRLIEDSLNAYQELQDNPLYDEVIDPLWDTAIDSLVVEQGIKEIIKEINRNYYEEKNVKKTLKESVLHVVKDLSENNLFGFDCSLVSSEEGCIKFVGQAGGLREFMDGNKVDGYERDVNLSYAKALSEVARQTYSVVRNKGWIDKIIHRINKDFSEKNFAGVIDKIEIRTQESEDPLYRTLKDTMDFHGEHGDEIGEKDLFFTGTKDDLNRAAVSLLSRLNENIELCKQEEFGLTDTFNLQFRVVENGNDTTWVDRLANVGSDGTDVLVKSMINIMLLNVLKKDEVKKAKDGRGEFVLHCLMDEVGKLHPENVAGILQFANDRDIHVVHGSPTENNPLAYKYIYELSKTSDQERHTEACLITENIEA